MYSLPSELWIVHSIAPMSLVGKYDPSLTLTVFPVIKSASKVSILSDIEMLSVVHVESSSCFKSLANAALLLVGSGSCGILSVALGMEALIELR